jgi:hypothetical protein
LSKKWVKSPMMDESKPPRTWLDRTQREEERAKLWDDGHTGSPHNQVDLSNDPSSGQARMIGTQMTSRTQQSVDERCREQNLPNSRGCVTRPV